MKKLMIGLMATCLPLAACCRLRPRRERLGGLWP